MLARCFARRQMAFCKLSGGPFVEVIVRRVVRDVDNLRNSQRRSHTLHSVNHGFNDPRLVQRTGMGGTPNRRPADDCGVLSGRIRELQAKQYMLGPSNVGCVNSRPVRCENRHSRHCNRGGPQPPSSPWLSRLPMVGARPLRSGYLGSTRFYQTR